MGWLFFKDASLDNLRRLRDQAWALRIIDFEHRYQKLNWIILGWLIQRDERNKVRNVYAIAGCRGTPLLGVIDIVSWDAVKDVPIVMPEGLEQFMYYGLGDIVYVKTKDWDCCFDNLSVFEVIVESNRTTEVMDCVRRFHREYPTRRRHVLGYIYAHLDAPKAIAVTLDLDVPATPEVRLVDVAGWCQKEGRG
jgi:hypothetical protein